MTKEVAACWRSRKLKPSTAARWRTLRRCCPRNFTRLSWALGGSFLPCISTSVAALPAHCLWILPHWQAVTHHNAALCWQPYSYSCFCPSSVTDNSRHHSASLTTLVLCQPYPDKHALFQPHPLSPWPCSSWVRSAPGLLLRGQALEEVTAGGLRPEHLWWQSWGG